MFDKKNNAFGFFAAVIFALFCSGTYAETDTSSGIKPSLENTVGKMLMLDAAIAYKYEQDRLKTILGKEINAPGVVKTSAAPQVSATEPQERKPAPTAIDKPKELPPVLLAIFGVSERLYADVKINNESFRFQRGRDLPISGSSVTSYRLSSINLPCVTLNKSGEITTICMDKSGL